MAEEPVHLADSYSELAFLLNPALNIDLDQAAKIRLIKETLGRRQKWLLVFDNVRPPEDIEEYIPPGGAGHVVITSTNANAWSGMAREQPLPLFTRDESTDYLLNTTDDKEDRDSDLFLADELERLPLALEHAAAYIRKNNITLADYRDLFKDFRNRLFDEKTAKSQYHSSLQVDLMGQVCADTIGTRRFSTLGLLSDCQARHRLQVYLEEAGYK